ncbi:hypothetical protein HU200_005675 [Digitaria exilis]|uniref:Fe2OG dioxygenase domain-containing protein n=1 Tax=Digitaria exilis TaxID=1010633 RepID=A0A835FRY5_9POAL|nr:hypothetical protein HU200_005675 [Digitaria exilis]CAB3469941.1 unnamed protein product [Digitaria exilis]
MSTKSAAAATGGYDRQRELQAFDDTKAGVKGLVDAGVTAIPAIFHHPPDALALNSASSSDDDTATIPVVDLSGAPREEVVARVKAAAETVGFFQVVNHGVPAELMDAMLAGIKRFNEGPAEAKRRVYTRDTVHKVRFSSNFDLFKSAAASWRDTLFSELAPVPPRPEELPDAVRDVILEYGEAATKLAVRVLELLSESLGLPSDHLREMGCAEGLNMVSHYYPPCPEPHLTLGTSSHTDACFLTVLLQDGVGGLQVLVDRDGGGRRRWVDVPPLPGALIVNIGDLLQVCVGSLSTTEEIGSESYARSMLLALPVPQLVSNDRFRSVEHRVVANSSRDTARLSVACFFNADIKGSTRLYGPITEGSDDPPLYRSDVTVQEFMARAFSKGIQARSLDYFRLEQ